MDKASQAIDALQKSFAEIDLPEDLAEVRDDINQYIDLFQADPENASQPLSERLKLVLIDFDADYPDLARAIRVAITDLTIAGV